jgi:hypothetical protein
MKNYTRIIVQRGEPMTDAEITQALRVSDQTEWYRALIQLIDQCRGEYQRAAYSGATINNPLSQASDIGAHEALTGLMLELENRRAG